MLRQLSARIDAAANITEESAVLRQELAAVDDQRIVSDRTSPDEYTKAFRPTARRLQRQRSRRSRAGQAMRHNRLTSRACKGFALVREAEVRRHKTSAQSVYRACARHARYNSVAGAHTSAGRLERRLSVVEPLQIRRAQLDVRAEQQHGDRGDAREREHEHDDVCVADARRQRAFQRCLRNRVRQRPPVMNARTVVLAQVRAQRRVERVQMALRARADRVLDARAR